MHGSLLPLGGLNLPRLNQIVALVATKKGRAASVMAEQQSRITKSGLLDGIARQYQPKADDGEKLPSENKLVQVKAMEAFAAVAAEASEVFDLVLTQDYGNAQVLADVVVNGRKLIEGCPVPYLLFLEKKLKEIEAFIGGLPTLDPGDVWKLDPVSDCYASTTKQTVHTRKTPKNHVKAVATAQHPAQVETYMEDVVVGYWNTTKFSGAIPAQEKNGMLARVRQIRDAVKMAKEDANGIEVRPLSVGNSIFGFIRSPEKAA